MLISMKNPQRKKRLKNNKCIKIVYFNVPVVAAGIFYIYLHIKKETC